MTFEGQEKPGQRAKQRRKVKTVKDKGLTEDVIDHLSPRAAQASRLLKSGITLTGIYAQMVNLSEELTADKEETRAAGRWTKWPESNRCHHRWLCRRSL